MLEHWGTFCAPIYILHESKRICHKECLSLFLFCHVRCDECTFEHLLCPVYITPQPRVGGTGLDMENCEYIFAQSYGESSFLLSTEAIKEAAKAKLKFEWLPWVTNVVDMPLLKLRTSFSAPFSR